MRYAEECGFDAETTWVLMEATYAHLHLDSGELVSLFYSNYFRIF